MVHSVQTLILGAGAAGLMCAAHAGPDVLVVDHAKAPAEKIRISGGGRCNFTNMYTEPENFLSENIHFAKSALSRYTQWDFLDLVTKHGIPHHEKTLGQLFCDRSAKDIIAMLLAEMGPAKLWLQTEIAEVSHRDGAFHVTLTREGKRHAVVARNLVLATGGKSIPKMGATGLAYRLAAQFGHRVTETRPALVPLTFEGAAKAHFAALSGTSVPARVACNGTSFDEGMLFTHRGLSGPSILQISSYWTEGDTLSLHLLPETDLYETLRAQRTQAGGKALTTILADHLPKKLVQHLAEAWGLSGNLADQSDTALRALTERLSAWHVTPTSSEGYRTAEVTLGGIATEGLSSRTMESQHVSGLYVIGEAADVTGWLGGYNFQWAWSSGVAAGRAITGQPGH
ncbi:NAD(P)/FAD-dependent oxidoreductase [Rhodobacteraceae bacterium N5(2021)]|uniref:NAD(P)/FAD-dependent oxidoreductase n=1 Tax=Gymnodinialimonas phycosphaerae TaxID=2841589 RepID=A0A975YGF9_9RHOB|nr:NAD(P)/FAD-dependent oxidoreductase [Gymnodinialimonas phycosphaerae]MBY4891663.1 NAD(P)/FAD-dependent oxidoreductase [Gymnodinialimonas phycosphaerae]